MLASVVVVVVDWVELLQLVLLCSDSDERLAQVCPQQILGCGAHWSWSWLVDQVDLGLTLLVEVICVWEVRRVEIDQDSSQAHWEPRLRS